MSLFVPEQSSVTDLSARRIAHLPVPTRERWMPLRAGVLNVWEYDDQQFWFEDGRLLLRGRNESGKSKALELLFPFALDGDISPKKLDPFDTANKSMWWNLIGFHKERTTAIGYLWIEFGHLVDGGAEYLTSIAGLQSTRAERRVASWFALTPQRVDADLDLAPGQVCRSRESFEQALAPGSRFSTSATAHRANVAAHLFHMSPERYENLLHLLRQLRKPKLADKLDNKKLSVILTEALPPLDDSRLEPLATGFAYLDADIDDLRRTEEAHSATGVFLDLYRAYARSQVRRRADGVRSAITDFDNVTREEKEKTQQLEDARSRHHALTEEAGGLAHRLAEASGSLGALDLSSVEFLRLLEQQSGADRRTVTHLDDEHRRAADEAGRAGRRAVTAAGRMAEQEEVVARVLADARRISERARVPGGWEDPEADHVRSAGQLTAGARARRSLVDAVGAAEGRAAGARTRLAVSNATLEAAQQKADEAADLLAAAAQGVDTARGMFTQGVEAWRDAAPSHRPDVDGPSVAADIEGRLPEGQRAATEVASGLARGCTGSAAALVVAATRAHSSAEEQRQAAEQRLAEHDALPEDAPPPPRPGVPPERRAGAPLWQLVEFDPGLDPGEAALLEAALDAAGLLDAVVTTEGRVRLHDDDTFLLPAPGGRGVGDWLKPADGADAGLVTTALATIGAGPASGHPCWVDLDGAWANGPLTGRWAKPAPEHIGAAARAAARARRREELQSALDRAVGAEQTAAAELAGARDAEQAATRWVDAFPGVSDWALAEHDRAQAERRSIDADGALRRVATAHAELSRQVEGLLAAVAAAVQAAGCTPAEVPSARADLDQVLDRAGELAQAAHVRATAATAVAETAEEHRRLAAAADAVSGRLDAARLTAAASNARYRTALDTQGAEVARILEEKERLERDVESLRDRQQAVESETAEALRTEVRAQAILEETARRREAMTSQRDAALAGLVSFVRTGHVALCVATDADRAADEYLQVTAGRSLARQISAAVPESEGSDAAANQAKDRLVRGYTALHNAVGVDFDPHIEHDAEDLVIASAILNGDVIGIADLHQALADDVAQRRQAIAAEERSLIEQHLRDEVGSHLGERLYAATTEIEQMDAILRRHPTSSGATVHLRWTVDDTSGPSVRDAIKALLTSPATRDEAASTTLATFLAERVALARRGEVEGADLAERLAVALDYRRWHHFTVDYRGTAGETPLTARTIGASSGGHQAKIAHLPLLAAAAGFYSSSPSAPRPCFLDEAFAGIDGPNTADLLAMSVTLDLDMVMTNYDAWFCVPELPGLAIYHLEKLAGALGVAALRYEWDGGQRLESDPWLDA